MIDEARFLAWLDRADLHELVEAYKDDNFAPWETAFSRMLRDRAIEVWAKDYKTGDRVVVDCMCVSMDDSWEERGTYLGVKKGNILIRLDSEAKASRYDLWDIDDIHKDK